MIVQKYGDFDYKVKAAIAVGLWVGDIVLALHKPYIVLLQKCFFKLVYVRRKCTDYPYSRNVVEVLLDAVHCNRIVLAMQLFQNALRRFEPRLDSFYRIAVVLQRQLLVEHVELGFHFHHRAAVVTHQFTIRQCVILHQGFDFVFFAASHLEAQPDSCDLHRFSVAYRFSCMCGNPWLIFILSIPQYYGKSYQYSVQAHRPDFFIGRLPAG